MLRDGMCATTLRPAFFAFFAARLARLATCELLGFRPSRRLQRRAHLRGVLHCPETDWHMLPASVQVFFPELNHRLRSSVHNPAPRWLRAPAQSPCKQPGLAIFGQICEGKTGSQQQAERIQSLRE